MITEEQLKDIKEFGDVYHTRTGLVTYKRKGKYYLKITQDLLEEISVNVFWIIVNTGVSKARLKLI